MYIIFIKGCSHEQAIHAIIAENIHTFNSVQSRSGTSVHSL